ncbi:MAG TPA: PIG-L deacetylase family protein [Acidimicrobiales bacterium]|nr:PIG-L deacetylase family protein [Acidimicrobiales bacterium]
MTPDQLVDTVPGVALAFYAHPDDADVACGGTLAAWAEAGCQVHLVICTDGGRGTTDARIDPAELVRRRAGELAASAVLTGLVSHHVLGLPDGELTDGPELRAEMVGWVRRLRPDVVCGHDPTAVFFGRSYFNHRDHRMAGWAMLDAVSPAAALPHYFSDRGPPHQVRAAYLSATLEPDVWVDITATIETKVAAVLCHASQFAPGEQWAGEAVRQRAREEGRRVGVPFAEGFRLLQFGE